MCDHVGPFANQIVAASCHLYVRLGAALLLLVAPIPVTPIAKAPMAAFHAQRPGAQIGHAVFATVMAPYMHHA